MVLLAAAVGDDRLKLADLDAGVGGDLLGYDAGPTSAGPGDVPVAGGGDGVRHQHCHGHRELGEHRWPHSSMPAPLREVPHAVDVAPESDRQNIDRVGRVVDAVHHPIGTQGAAVRPAPTTVVMNSAEVVEHHAGADTVVVVAKDLKHDSSECCLDLGPDVF